MNNYALALPEIVIALFGCLLTLLSAFLREKYVLVVTWGAALALLAGAYLTATMPTNGLAFSDMFIQDDLSRYGKILIFIASAASLFLAPSFLRDTKNLKPEYAVLVLFTALGMAVMVSANSLLSLYLGLEVHNLALYVLVAFCRNDNRSSEAALKYYILGAVSSAILLFGLSLLYGVVGGLGFAALSVGTGTAYALGMAFVIAGFAFKISAVPFHMWAPDVYEGGSTPVTAFLLAAPKVAGFVLLARILVGPFAGMESVWQPMLAVFAVASVLLGSLGGLAQTNIKRLLAYSAIINVGIMLIGLTLLAKGDAGVMGLSGTLLYLVLYFMGTIALFAGVLMLRKDGQPIEYMNDLSGLLKTHPLLATCLGAALFSLAGIPPLAGFFGKYKVLLAAVKGDAMWLAVIGVLGSVIAAAYYLRVIKIIAFDPPSEKQLKMIDDKPLYTIALASALSVVLFMIIPAPLMNITQAAAESLLK